MNIQDATDFVRNQPEVAQKAQELLAQVLTRSTTDPEFRKLLVSDSRAALTQHFGKEPPASTNIVFIENKADATVVLPDPIDPSAELSEAELEAVAGGITPGLAVVAAGYCIAWAADAIF